MGNCHKEADRRAWVFSIKLSLALGLIFTGLVFGPVFDLEDFILSLFN